MRWAITISEGFQSCRWLLSVPLSVVNTYMSVSVSLRQGRGLASEVTVRIAFDSIAALGWSFSVWIFVFICRFPIIVVLPAGFFSGLVMLRLSLRALCGIIVESFDLYNRPYKTQSRSTSAVSLGFISLWFPQRPCRKQKICIPHLSMSSWQNNAAPRTNVSDEKVSLIRFCYRKIKSEPSI